MIIPARRRRESLLSRIFGKLRPTLNCPEFVIDEASFRFQLEKERCRADRRGIEFCLIEFGKVDADFSEDEIRQLLVTFRKRLRITDEIGLLGHDLGVLLPDTPADGGCKVATELTEIAAGQNLALNVSVSVYPDDEKKSSGKPKNNQYQLFDEDFESNNGYKSNGNANGNGNGKATTAEETSHSMMVKNLMAETMVFSTPTPFWKRTFDIFASLAGIICFSPVMIGAACFIKLTSKGPVFFVQLREGKDAKPFRIFKFRTMVVDAEAMRNDLLDQNEQDGPAFKIAKDPRLTKIGKFLRKSCIDELPQLFNVFKGEMSMVGPRPLPVAESEECQRWQRRRLDVLPGMTCIWQVDGGRDVDFDDWMRMDLDYLKRRNPKFDLKLLYKTAHVALFHRGSV